MELCLSHRAQRATEVSNLAKLSFLAKSLFLIWEELSTDTLSSNGDKEGIYHTSHCARMMTGGLFVLFLFKSQRFQKMAKHMCFLWALPFPLLDELLLPRSKQAGEEMEKK